MSLTGEVFLDGIVLLTLAAFVAVVAWWPRLARPTPWNVAGRVGALVVVNLLVLLCVASRLNASYLFFAGWGDLRSAMTGHIAQTSLHRGGVERDAADLPVRGRAARVAARPQPPSGPVSRSGLAEYLVHGPLSGLTGTVLVQLPPGYLSAEAAHERYPVIEAFHGYPSEPLNWVKVFHIGRMVDRLVRDHELRAPLVVMPQLEFPDGVDTEGVDGRIGQPQVETWLTRDIPDWIGQHFRVVPDRDAWATLGYSAGGFTAGMAAILHPAQYGAGMMLSGYFSPKFAPVYVPFTSGSPLGRRYDLARRISTDPPPLSLWVETSRADRVSYASSMRFLRATRPPTAVRAVVLRSAGHRDGVWIAMMPQALRWLGSEVAGFRP